MTKKLLAIFFMLTAAAAFAEDTPYEEVVVKNASGMQFPFVKPRLELPLSPLQAIMTDLDASDMLVLADSSLDFTWRSNRPQTLFTPKMINPANFPLVCANGFTFDVPVSLADADITSQDAGIAWELSVTADDGGTVFSAKGETLETNPVEWNGQHPDGQWFRAGHNYAVMFNASDSAGDNFAGSGHPATLFCAVFHAAKPRMISADTAALFGPLRQSDEITPQGRPVLDAVLDTLRLYYPLKNLKLRILAATQVKAEDQGEAVRKYLASRLSITPESIGLEAAKAPASEQVLEIYVLN